MSEEFNLEQITKDYEKFTSFLKSSQELLAKREAARKKMAPTPRELLYQQHSVKVYRYLRQTPPSHRIPMLIVPSLVNRPTIMDHMKGESFVEGMLERGLDVYIIEWGEPTLAQSKYSLHYYLSEYLNRAVRRIKNQCQTEKVHLAGYCLGGALSVLFTALNKSADIQSLITMVTPVNFHDKGLLSFWAKEENLDIDKVVDTYGNVPAEFFSRCFPWLVPTANIKKARTIYEKQADDKFMESFLALDIWITENIPFPGEVYREVIKKGYQQNVLSKKKEWEFAPGTTASLKDITCPVLNLTALYDHVSPVESCRMLGDLLQTKTETHDYPIGHLGLALGKDAKNKPTGEFWDVIRDFVGRHQG